MDRSTKMLIWFCIGLTFFVISMLVLRHERTFRKELTVRKAPSIHKIESLPLTMLPSSSSLPDSSFKKECPRSEIDYLYNFDTKNITAETLNSFLTTNPKGCLKVHESLTEILENLKDGCAGHLKMLKTPTDNQENIYYNRRDCLKSIFTARRYVVDELFQNADLTKVDNEQLLFALIQSKISQLEPKDEQSFIQNFIDRHPNRYTAVRAALFATTDLLISDVLDAEQTTFVTEEEEDDEEEDFKEMQAALDPEDTDLPMMLFNELERISPEDADLPSIEVTLTRMSVAGYEETKEAFNSLLDKYPNYPSLYYLLAKNESRYNNNSDAKQLIKTAIEVDPTNSGYKEILRLLETGHLNHRYIFDVQRTQY